MGNDTVAVSAPGKVLLAGGYLVLDRAYTGLVFGLDARIHVIVSHARNPAGGEAPFDIVVTSPQFKDAIWVYKLRLADHAGGVTVDQLKKSISYAAKYFPANARTTFLLHLLTSGLHSNTNSNSNRNIFVETALGYALSYIYSVASPLSTPARITILADNDYYSTTNASSDERSSASQPSERFHNFGVRLEEANKTGLGSSAALVTAITAAILSFHLPRQQFDLTSEPSRRVLHNLAQAAHCAAQGKVGSGFDVASAVYGSCLYRRFSPSTLSNSADPGTPEFTGALRALVEESNPDYKWDTEIQRDAVKVPRGLRLVLCDVSGGSQTPGMVKQVLAWRKEKPQEADTIWTDLHAANEGLAKEMKALAEEQNFGLERLGACFRRIRSGIRTMSEKSGVPIEPPEQRELIDACEAVSGVVGGVVPGAGGYDAISLLIENSEATVSELNKLFERWNRQNEQVLSRSGRVSMLGVREEMAGVKEERWQDYDEWVA